MGWPIMSIQVRIMWPSGSTTSAKVFSSIRNTGSSTVTRVTPKLGRLLASGSWASCSTSSGEGLPGMRRAIRLPNSGPAMMAVGKATIRP
ncbi:hypothetical protein D3C78_1831340 [compost metagenome]